MTPAATARAPRAAAQADLFGPALLPGLASAEEAITRAEEARLIARIEGAALAPFQFQQWEGKRLTRSFGWTYDFQTGTFARGEALPDWLLPVRERAARLAGLSPEALEQALLIHYGPGAGIGWHRDRAVFEHVIGLSLGAPAMMRFRRRSGSRFERATLELPPRGLYRLSGEARDAWEHSIAAMELPRWSITFRSLRSR